MHCISIIRDFETFKKRLVKISENNFYNVYREKDYIVKGFCDFATR